MPVYTYRCENCGVQFERHQSFNDAPLKACPECRKKSLRKVIGPSRIIFKGSGFYVTDNKSSSSGKSVSAKKKDDSKTVSESTAATETKAVKEETRVSPGKTESSD
jgi:putative FmdB family regulatory protein